MRSSGLKALFIALAILCCATWVTAAEAKVPVVPDSCPCADSINKLGKAYQSDPQFRELMDLAFNNMKQLPPDYKEGNPWIGKGIADLIKFLESWCTFLPEINGTHDDGLKYIQDFVWFYYQNPFGIVFVQQAPGRDILKNFVRQRGAYMDSKASTKKVALWLNDPRVEKEDYFLPDPKAPDGGFKSYNQFFARTFKNQDQCRPQTMPDRDYVISAPTDCVMNSIPQLIIDQNTPVTTKGNESLNIIELLGNSKLAKRFIGGTALSCVLMPNTYHHYHSPVGGKVVEARVIEDAFFGYDNFPKWAPQSGNVGYYGTDFSQFQNFKRGYFIVDTGKYGHVAMVAVGLNTISSVVFEKKFKGIKKPVPVKRGERLGHFLYGGSLFIMIFEPGRYKSDAIQVRLGNQIGTFDTPPLGKKK
jgi:phosphatidylserine decarboxylase